MKATIEVLHALEEQGDNGKLAARLRAEQSIPHYEEQLKKAGQDLAEVKRIAGLKVETQKETPKDEAKKEVVNV